MSFGEFCNKYLGIIIGIAVASLIIILGFTEIVVYIAIIVSFAYLGRYIQKNKEKVKETIKSFVDRL